MLWHSGGWKFRQPCACGLSLLHNVWDFNKKDLSGCQWLECLGAGIIGSIRSRTWAVMDQTWAQLTLLAASLSLFLWASYSYSLWVSQNKHSCVWQISQENFAAQRVILSLAHPLWSFFRWGNWGLEKRSDLPTVILSMETSLTCPLNAFLLEPHHSWFDSWFVPLLSFPFFYFSYDYCPHFFSLRAKQCYTVWQCLNFWLAECPSIMKCYFVPSRLGWFVTWQQITGNLGGAVKEWLEN
jgi:hypothetical protein